MQTRAAQREATRERIVEAAVACFSERGFQGASTREIARRAGANQGLITYHFRSKDELWRAAADRIIGELRESLGDFADTTDSEDARGRAREGIRAFVRFNAAHPEFFRFMVEQGKHDDERTRWLVETHLRPLYEALPEFGPDGTLKAHAYYAVVGAGSVPFAVAPECRRLTGLDPSSPDAIEAHADFVARLLIP